MESGVMIMCKHLRVFFSAQVSSTCSNSTQEVFKGWRLYIFQVIIVPFLLKQGKKKKLKSRYVRKCLVLFLAQSKEHFCK